MILYGDFIVKLVWVLSGNLIYNIVSMKTPDNFQTNFTMKSLKKVSLSTLSPYNLHTNHSGNLTRHVFSIKPKKNYIISPHYAENTFTQCIRCGYQTPLYPKNESLIDRLWTRKVTQDHACYRLRGFNRPNFQK